MSERICVYCNNTGVDVDGNPCSCGRSHQISLSVNVVNPYSKLKFDVELLPSYLSEDYVKGVNNIIKSVSNIGRIEYNALICSPIGSGKTVFSENIINIQKSLGIQTMPVYDLFEVKDNLMSYGNDEFKKSFITCPLIVIRIPLQVPYDVGNLVELIVSRRVRYNCFTIFTYSSEYSKLVDSDKSGVITQIVKDGTLCTLKLIK